MRGICAGGRCRNLEGGYRCECPPGLLLTSDGQKCIGKIRDVCIIVEYRSVSSVYMEGPSAQLVYASSIDLCSGVSRGFWI